MQLDVHAVLLAEARHDVAGNPHLVGGAAGALAEDLVLPLALGDLGVDALDVDSARDADVDVLLDDLARNAADIPVTHARVIRTLGRRESVLGKAERGAVLVQEILLLEPEPGVRIVGNRRPRVRRVGLAAGQQHLRHHEEAVRAGAIGEERDWLQQTVRTLAFGLLSRASVEAPHREVRKLQLGGIAVYDLGLAAEAGDGGVAVEPDVFEFDSSHVWMRVWSLGKEGRLCGLNANQGRDDWRIFCSGKHHLCH